MAGFASFAGGASSTLSSPSYTKLLQSKVATIQEQHKYALADNLALNDEWDDYRLCSIFDTIFDTVDIRSSENKSDHPNVSIQPNIIEE